MFTGLVEEIGLVERIERGAHSVRLSVLSRVCAKDTRVGDSVAVNGCCLTVVKSTTDKGTKHLEFDLLCETWERTNLHAVKPGAAVNLERSLPAQGRIGGHFVTGHIDGTGTIRRWEQVGSDWVLEVAAPRELMRYLVFKGSVALDGISLTVAQITRQTCRIWIIPHTYAVTALRERAVGDLINIEADLLGKYVEKFLALRESTTQGRVRRPRLVRA